ncbi:MAG: hypothetical protein Q8L88_01145 [Bacteroidota bacterium]|nr:hypothetical protein [Bacteroidota bacterium]
MDKNSKLSRSHSDAVFIGWQENSFGESFALYNIIIAGHPLFGSTVTAASLRDMNLRVPDSPISIK